MELYYDVLRVLSLVIVWAIPATLVVAVAAFVIVAPALTLGGVLIRLYEIVCLRLRRRARAEAQGVNLACSVDVDCPVGYICVGGYCVPKPAS